MKTVGKRKLTAYFTLLMFICTWITINLSFPAISIAMSADHKFRIETIDGNSHIVFFHPENEEHEHGYLHDHEHHSFKFSYNQVHHEHDFQLANDSDQIIIANNLLLNIDVERAPPLTPIIETFNYIPGKYFPFRYYKYPLGVNTTSLSIKTTVLLI